MRRQPLSKRRLVAFSITLLFVGVLFVLWLTVWLPDFNRQNEIADKNASLNTPKDNFMQNFSAAWGNVSDEFSQLKNALQSGTIKENLSGGVQYMATSTTTSTSQNTAVEPAITVIEVSSTTDSTTQN
ncbi:MAG: hypothetical protein Q8915_19100 [Bacillota bacterium]|nr:hypothetical protein [Bacillota bacterium]